MMADFHMVSHKKAEDHYDYMIQKKILPALKGGGQTVLALLTTTNQTATTTAKLLRNHANFVAALEMVCGFNNNLSKYTQVEDFFCLNLDETNFMASEGTLRIVGNKNKKNKRKTQMTVEIESRLFVLALLPRQKVLTYSLQRERA